MWPLTAVILGMHPVTLREHVRVRNNEWSGTTVTCERMEREYVLVGGC